MNRRTFVVGVSGFAAWLLLAPQTAFAASTWGEIVFEVTGSSNIVRLAERWDAASSSMVAYRWLQKSGTSPWTWSHGEGSGIAHSTFLTVQDAAARTQADFDVQASSAVGTWYSDRTTTAKTLLRDVTRQTSATVFFVRTQEAGASDAATMADFDAMKAAAEVGDRAAFDAAATAAWGTWYTGLSPAEADIIYGILIDAPSLG